MHQEKSVTNLVSLLLMVCRQQSTPPAIKMFLNILPKKVEPTSIRKKYSNDFDFMPKNEQ